MFFSVPRKDGFGIARVLIKSKEWAVKCKRMVHEGNAELKKLGIPGTITDADIAQISDNPQQAAAADQISQGKPATGEQPPAKPGTAKMAEFDESKHKRADDGKFGTEMA